MKHTSLKRIVPIVAALACALAPGTALGAQAGSESVLELDPAQTHIEFTLDTLLHTVHGSFRMKRGTIHFDPASGHIGGEIVADATSGATGSGSRDRRMHKDIIESQRYPEITFVPDRVDGTIDLSRKSELRIHGMFNIHGAAHELVLPVEVDAANGRIEARTSFSVPYIQWGMKNPSTLFLRVSDKVDIHIDAVGTLSR